VEQKTPATYLSSLGCSYNPMPFHYQVIEVIESISHLYDVFWSCFLPHFSAFKKRESISQNVPVNTYALQVTSPLAAGNIYAT
jgi:hypothetical protein